MATSDPQSPNPNITIRESDLVGDCTRLNRVISMLWQKIGVAAPGTTVENITNISGGGGTPATTIRIAY